LITVVAERAAATIHYSSPLSSSNSRSCWKSYSKLQLISDNGHGATLTIPPSRCQALPARGRG